MKIRISIAHVVLALLIEECAGNAICPMRLSLIQIGYGDWGIWIVLKSPLSG
jgi:hypothetical protein